MKTKTKQNKILWLGLGAIAIILTVVSIMCPDLLGITGLTIAAAGPIAGPVDTENLREASEKLVLDDVSKRVSQIRADEAPLDTLLRNSGVGEKSNGQIFRFYENVARGNSDKLLAASTASVAAGDSVDLKIEDSRNFVHNDILYIPSIATADGKTLHAMVVGKNIAGTNTIRVIAINGNGGDASYHKMPAMTIGTEFYSIGTAKNERDAKSDAVQKVPTDVTNFCQLMMTQVSQSVFAEMTKKEVDYGMAQYKADELWQHRYRANLAAMFGKKSRFTHDDKVYYTTGGVLEFAGLSLEYAKDGSGANAMSKAYFNSLTRQIFSMTNGSNMRMLLCGSNAMERLQNIEDVQKQLSARDSEIVFGVKFNKIVTGFGELKIKYDKSMNLAGHADDIMIIDPNHIYRREMLSPNWRELDLMKTGESRTNDWVFEECFGLEVRHPECHGIIRGV